MKTKLIYVLIGSRRRVGKDTFANILIEELKRSQCSAYRKPFAEALRQEVHDFLQHTNLKDVDVWSEEPQLKEQVTRPILIAWGQAQRYYDLDYWVNQVAEFGTKAKRRHQELLDGPGGDVLSHHCFVVVPDWRFPNELARIRAEAYREDDFVLALNVDRPGIPLTIPDEIENSPICTRLADFHIANTGTVEDLRAVAGGTLRNYFMPIINARP